MNLLAHSLSHIDYDVGEGLVGNLLDDNRPLNDFVRQGYVRTEDLDSLSAVVHVFTGFAVSLKAFRAIDEAVRFGTEKLIPEFLCLVVGGTNAGSLWVLEFHFSLRIG